MGSLQLDHRNFVCGDLRPHLPIFKTGNGLDHKLLGGWSLDGVFTYTMLDRIVSDRYDHCRIPAAQPGIVHNNGPIQYTNQYSQGGAAADPNFFFKPNERFRTAEFTPPPAGTINSQRVRDAFYGPAYWDLNSALFKEFQMNRCPTSIGSNTTPSTIPTGAVPIPLRPRRFR